jgi:GT2 family glycosyltransferase
VVTYNAPEDVKCCLESVVGVTVSRTFELIVVDNGSDAALVKWMCGFAGEHESVQMHRLDSNAGFARGVNIGAGLARGAVLILLNSDTVVTDGWLDDLSEALADPTVGIVSPLTNNIGHGPQLDPRAVAVTPGTANAYAATLETDRRLVPVPNRLAFFCVAMRRTDFELLNGLDESYGIGNFEDDDLCLRAVLLGLSLGVLMHVFVYHRGGASFEENGVDHRRWLGKNADRFLDKASLLALGLTPTLRPARSGQPPAMSVVVRTKDRPSALRVALRSLERQSCPDFEVVVVNDGGTDVSPTLASFPSLRFRVVQHVRSVGRAEALNTGIRAASAPLIGYLDDDDVLLPFHVATLLEGAQGCEPGDRDIRYSHYSLAFVAPADGDQCFVTLARKRLDRWSFDRDELLVANRPALHTWIHEKALWERFGGFDPSYEILEDWEFLLRVTRDAVMTPIGSETCEYRISVDRGNATLDRSGVLEQILRVYDAYPSSTRRIAAERERHVAEWRGQIERLAEVDGRAATGELDDDEAARARFAIAFGVRLPALKVPGRVDYSR